MSVSKKELFLIKRLDFQTLNYNLTIFFSELVIIIRFFSVLTFILLPQENPKFCSHLNFEVLNV